MFSLKIGRPNTKNNFRKLALINRVHLSITLSSMIKGQVLLGSVSALWKTDPQSTKSQETIKKAVFRFLKTEKMLSVATKLTQV